jgi:hypothetical protein
MLRLNGLLGLGLIVAIAACSTDNHQTPQGPLPGGSTSQLISPDGGTVTTPDGVSIVVPAGAVSAPTFFSVMPATSQFAVFAAESSDFVALPADGGAQITAAVVSSPYDLEDDGTKLAAPATVELPFDPTKIPAGKSGSDVIIFGPAGYFSVVALPTSLVDATHVGTPRTALGEFIAGVPIPSM